MAADLDTPDLDGVRMRYTIEAFTRRAIATKLHEQWCDANLSEQADRVERLDTIMDPTDYALAGRHLITPIDRAVVMRRLDQIPRGNVRVSLDELQHRLGWQIAPGLGADNRRRLAEVRCKIIDALDALDRLDFYEARRLIVDAEHALAFMANNRNQQERPSRREMELDPRLRERANAVANELRRHAVSLRDIST